MNSSTRAGLVSLFLAFVVSLAPAAPESRPNLVLILADDLGYGEVSRLGQTRYETPNIDRLADEGITLTDHYAAPVCAPSRAALLTGLHNGHTAIRNNYGIRGSDGYVRAPLDPTELTVAQLLQRQGYLTALVGKWGLGEERSGSEPGDKGFDFFYGFLNQAHAHNQYPEFLYRGREKEALVENYSHEERVFANDRFTAEALGFLERAKESPKPFFLFLSYTTPHADLRCPPDTLAELKQRHPELAAPGVPETTLQFAAMVTRLDRDVGRVVAALQRLGLESNTLVIFTSDNGPHTGKDNAFFRSSGPFRGRKGDVYEGGIREPFFARWPGHIAPGSSSGHVSAFWDFLPTLCELAGAAIPAGIDGISYAPTLLGRAQAQREHEFLYWEILSKGRGHQAVRAGTWKLVKVTQDSPYELYDLAADPGEHTDVASAHPDVVARLAAISQREHRDNPLFPLRLPPGVRAAAESP